MNISYAGSQSVEIHAHGSISKRPVPYANYSTALIIEN